MAWSKQSKAMRENMNGFIGCIENGKVGRMGKCEMRKLILTTKAQRRLQEHKGFWWPYLYSLCFSACCGTRSGFKNAATCTADEVIATQRRCHTHKSWYHKIPLEILICENLDNTRFIRVPSYGFALTFAPL
jgi:hypothetical protein